MVGQPNPTLLNNSIKEGNSYHFLSMPRTVAGILMSVISHLMSNSGGRDHFHHFPEEEGLNDFDLPMTTRLISWNWKISNAEV